MMARSTPNQRPPGLFGSSHTSNTSSAEPRIVRDTVRSNVFILTRPIKLSKFPSAATSHQSRSPDATSPVFADLRAAGAVAACGPVTDELLHSARTVDFSRVNVAVRIDA